MRPQGLFFCHHNLLEIAAKANREFAAIASVNAGSGPYFFCSWR